MKLKYCLAAICAGLSTVTISAEPISYSTLPTQPTDVPWPTADWQRGALDSRIDQVALDAIVETLMSEASLETMGRTHALLVVHRGKVVLEQYDSHNSCDRIGHTMSIAKMASSAFAGFMVMDNALDIDAPADIPLWSSTPDDGRAQITPYQILTMTSGLEWDDQKILGNDFIEFAFGKGVLDLAGYVANKPLDYAPGSHFYYSDGSLSLIGELMRKHAGGDLQAANAYVRSRLFEPIGMANSEAEYDQKGVWYGSSGMRWSPCDLARFSLLYMRDGVWDGERLLPEGWVDLVRTPTAASMAETSVMPENYSSGYGMAAFVYDLDFQSDDPDQNIDAFGHLGFGGHVLKIIPSKDLILILFGSGAADPEKHGKRIQLIHDLGDLFPIVSETDPQIEVDASDIE